MLKPLLLFDTPKPIKVPILMLSNPHYFALQPLLTSKDILNDWEGFIVSTVRNTNSLTCILV